MTTKLTKKELEAAIEALSARIAGPIEKDCHAIEVYEAAQQKLNEQLERME